MDGMRRHMAAAREPVLVVPTRADAERYRRELAGEGALFGAQVWRFEDLIAEAVRRAGIEGPVLGGIARARLVAALAAGRVPGASNKERSRWASTARAEGA